MITLKIYGREGCPFCVKVKALAKKLEAEGYFDDVSYIDYQDVGISIDELSREARTQIKTVPVVFINGLYIGGYTDLARRYPI